MKQTALQQLIKIIKQKRKESEISNTLLRFVQIEAEKLLETEKQQIIDAFNLGQQKEAKQVFWTKGNQYYNETFKK